MVSQQLQEQQPQRRGLQEFFTIVLLPKCPAEGKGKCQASSECAQAPRCITLEGPVSWQIGKVSYPLLQNRRNSSRKHQPQHGIFLFLFGIILLGCFKVLYGEICPVTTLLHQKHHVNCKSIGKEGTFDGCESNRVSNSQVCYCISENIQSHAQMHRALPCFGFNRLGRHVKKHLPPLYLDRFVTEE